MMKISMEKKALVLALSRGQHHHFASLYNQPLFDVIEIDDWRPEIVQQLQPDLLITSSCDWYESAICIEEARRLKIPSLYIMDGIIEWRHQWENPRFRAGSGVPYNQPITTDKVACLGWRSARTLEAWGNIGKCEVVGAPRFDGYLTDPIPLRKPHDGPRRLLVMTANTPGFTPEQVNMVKRSLLDVKNYMSGQEAWEPIWRVKRGLDEELGLTDHYPELRGKPLRDALAVADASLTTPSTVLLESMLAGLSTAILDYSNSPQYVPAAWSVTAHAHLGSTLQDMIDPPARRLALQDEILYDCLACHTPAAPRIVHLAEKMINIGRTSRINETPLEFPGRILPLDLGGYALPSKYFEFSQLYPEHPIFKSKDLNALQRELVFAEQELKQLRKEVQLRRVGYWLKVVGLKISQALKKS